MEYLLMYFRKPINIDRIRSLILHRILLPGSVPILALMIWLFLTQTQSVRGLFPTPVAVGSALLNLLQDGSLLENLKISTVRALSGFLVGGFIGFGLGVLNGQFRLAEEIFNTPIQMIRNVPHLALLPLVLIWFGIGELSKLVLISLGTFFPIYLNTFHGIRYVNQELLEMGKVYGLSRWQLFKEIILPGAMSSILIGVRQSLGIMWLTLIVAEMIAAKSGIGYMATNAREFMLMDVVVLSLLIYAFLGSLSDLIASWAERVLLRWHANYRKE